MIKKIWKYLWTAMHPQRMYKFSTGMVIANLLLAVGALLFGLHGSIVQIFLASGLCFAVGAIGNLFILKQINKKNKD